MFRTSASDIELDSTLLRPSLFSIPKAAWMLGRRMSPSMISTDAPVWAKVMARLIVVVVLPSEGSQEVTTSVLGARPAIDNKTDVRRWRYASASGERESRSSNSAGCDGLTFLLALPFPFAFAFRVGS